MQLRLKPRARRSFISRNYVIKFSLIIGLFFIGIFLIDKIDISAPTKLIKQKISNDKLITLK
jgi:hypothetical protein